jgi:hypothetical protein
VGRRVFFVLAALLAIILGSQKARAELLKPSAHDASERSSFLSARLK